jgi:type IV secretory pathway VirB2 component (pilin)
MLSAKKQLLAQRGLAFHLWVAIAVFGLLTSLLLIAPSGAVQGFIRFLFAAPIFMALVLYTENHADLKKHLATFVGFFAIASLTLPLQMVIGPISWFAEISERGGLERYASLVGSLTSIGITVGVYIVIAHGVTGIRRIFLLAAIMLPAMISLNKSALANVAIGVFVLVYLNRRSISKMAIAMLGLGGILGMVYTLVPWFADRVGVSLQSFGFQATDVTLRSYDASVGDSAWARIFDLPRANLDALADLQSPMVYLTGGGFGMGNTALVPEEDVLAPMAHNQFAELLTVFGPIAGGILIVVIIAVGFGLWRAYKRTGHQIYLIVFIAFVLLMVNSIFANGTVYQPASASIFYLSMFVAAASKKLELGTDLGVMEPPVR